MKSNEILNALLFHSNPNMRIHQFINIFGKRNEKYEPKDHTEFHFIKNFNNPNIVVILNKTINAYIIGDRTERQNRSIISIKGDVSYLYNETKVQLIKRIRSEIKSEEDDFIPEQFCKRIIFIPKIKEGEDHNLNEIQAYFFNKISNGSLLRRGEWTITPDIYNLEERKYKTDFNEIMKNIMKEI